MLTLSRGDTWQKLIKYSVSTLPFIKTFEIFPRADVFIVVYIYVYIYIYIYIYIQDIYGAVIAELV